MVAIECPVCEREISAEASKCPGCGHPMKRLLDLNRDGPLPVILLLLVIAGLGCGIWYMDQVSGANKRQLEQAEQNLQDAENMRGVGGYEAIKDKLH